MQAITQQFVDINPAQFEALVAAVKEQTGVLITGTSGTAQDAKKKWSVDFNFAAETGDLTITVTKAPWPDSMLPSAIATQIKELVQGVLEA